MHRMSEDCGAVEVEEVEWALWCVLMCMCGDCGTALDIPDYNNSPWNGDVAAWARDMAPSVQSQGWTQAPDGFNLLCPNCGRGATG